MESQFIMFNQSESFQASVRARQMSRSVRQCVPSWRCSSNLCGFRHLMKGDSWGEGFPNWKLLEKSNCGNLFFSRGRGLCLPFTNLSMAVKSYSRPAAGKVESHPQDLRQPDVLKATAVHLCKFVVHYPDSHQTVVFKRVSVFHHPGLFYGSISVYSGILFLG